MRAWTTRRFLLLTCGIATLSLGIIGIVVPVLPTTPFLLLAAYCFARSSSRLHTWLMTNHVFGRYIRSYIEKTGLPWRARLIVVAILWAGIAVSAIVTNGPAIRVLLGTVGVAVTLHVATLRPRLGATEERGGALEEGAAPHPVPDEEGGRS